MSKIETRIREALNPDQEPMASTCCHGQCLQGRSCPYREACTLEDLPRPRPDYSVEIAAVMAFVVILGTWGLIWLWELWI